MMRLICPECEAQYEIADGLIPPEGRDVECSACGHGWHQPGAPKLLLTAEAAIDDDDADEAGPPPAPAHAIADPVLAILREEAERELSARAEERAARRDPLAAGIAEATRRPPPPSPAGAALPDPLALAASLQWEVPARPDAEVPQPQLPPPAPLPSRAPQPRPPSKRPPSAAALRQRAHDRGFAVAMLVAALLAGAYVATPSLAGRGEVGARLMDARAGADRGRLWLQAQAESLADGAIAGARNLFR